MKTAPWKHQAEMFERSKDRPYFAFFAEQRTGKTKPVIDCAAYRFSLPPSDPSHVDALLIVAMPSGVPANWVLDEIPAHLPDSVPRSSLVWSARRAHTKAFREEAQALLSFPGLAVLAVNGEAVITSSFEDYLKRFLAARRVLFAADETTLIMKAPDAKRTRAMHSFGRHRNVVQKFIMDGTPVGEGPFDLYSQVSFLSPSILGFTSFFAFKMRYGEWEKGYRFDPKTGKDVEYPVLQSYKNLDELTARLAPHSFRITRKEAFPNMPDQVFAKVRFDLSPEQRRVYDRLRDEAEAELRDGTSVSAPHVLTRLLRLQQIASNRWPSERAYGVCAECRGDGCEVCDRIGAVELRIPERVIDDRVNPRLEALRDQISRTSEPFIVWCRFSADVDDCLRLCDEMGRRPVRYDGAVSAEGKVSAKADFTSGRAGALVGNPTSGGRGLTLRAAKTIYNYSHFFSLLVYLQGNDRAEDPLASRGTAIVDLVADATVDEDVVEAHRLKASVADLIMARPAGARLR